MAALSSSVSHNTATEAGGGIAVAGEALVMAASTTMVENVGVNGGAVDIQGKAAVAMCSCTVQRNAATMFGGGALVNVTRCCPRLPHHPSLTRSGAHVVVVVVVAAERSAGHEQHAVDLQRCR